MTAKTHESLEAFVPEHDFLVCIDSDGCAFDSMGIKQRECFCPWMIAAFGLQPVAAVARECKEFADLYSKTRGANRHITIKRILTELLPRHPQVREREFRVPEYPWYFRWIEHPGSVLSNDGLRRAMEDAKDPEVRAELRGVLEWSERVNWAIQEIVRGIPPFPGVRQVLESLQDRADVVVVSATPLDALEREWAEHGLASFVDLICGQEMGSKKEHILTVGRHYDRQQVLMLGDAPGDLAAARACEVLFFPIVPGEETRCWGELLSEGLDRFLHGTFRGEYEQRWLERFDRALPAAPPWEETQQ